LTSAVRTPLGELQLAGTLKDARGLDPRAMRVLGSFSLIYMVDMDGYYCDAHGVKRDLVSGDLVLIWPELAHAYGPKQGKGWNQIYFVFDGPEFEFWRERGLLSPERPVLHLEPVDYWRRRFEEVVGAESRHGAGAPLRAMGRFLHLLSDILAANADARGNREAWLEQALQLLGTPSADGWPTPQHVARAVGLSYDNFRKQFAARTGVSPGLHQKRQRIERACAALYQGNESFKELAEQLEFCDVFHFSKAFKQVVGLTPSEFRKKVRGG
jgi:AraC-like DNA-binding protein